MSVEIIMSLLLGIGLSAAMGMRIFVPALLASVASYLGWVSPGDGFAWIGTMPAIIAFGSATVLEVGAYYIPWLDNALDTAAAPIAVIAGGLMATSFLQIENEALRWILGMLAGGSSAGLIQLGSSALRLGSTGTTGGLANPLVSTGELLGSFSLSLLSLLAPAFALLLLLVLGVLFYRMTRKIRNRRKSTEAQQVEKPQA